MKQTMISILFVLVLAATLASPASAAQPPCAFGPLNDIGTAPYTETFHISDPHRGTNYSWNGGDGTGGYGETFTHTWGAGKFLVESYADENGYITRCRTWTTVLPATATATPVVTQTPMPTVTPQAVTIVIPAGSLSVDTVSGHDNLVVSGDQNTVIIKQPVVAQPVVISTPTISQATPKNFFWQIIHGFLAAFVSWDTWIVEHH